MIDLIQEHQAAILPIVTIAAMWVFYRIATRSIRAYAEKRSFKDENVQNFLLIWRYIWLAIIVMFALISFSGSIAALGISAAFLGMILGWSLQAPVTGMAAWLMIILKRPFKIGDRVIIAGITGDVIDITLTHIILNQVGGTIGGEEKSGRGVLIPNATLFQQIIYNYTMESEFILDEITILITFESDSDKAEALLLQSANESTADIINKTEQQPFVRYEIGDSGIRLRLRYQTMATDRQRISSIIVCKIIQAVNETPGVEFAYPHTEIVHRAKD